MHCGEFYNTPSMIVIFDLSELHMPQAVTYFYELATFLARTTDRRTDRMQCAMLVGGESHKRALGY